MKDLTGLKINRLSVVRRSKSNRNGSIVWECKCECGTICHVSSDHLTRKKNPVKSCGCLKRTSGSAHKDWKGYGEISAAWWHYHIQRGIFGESTRRSFLEGDLTIQQAWHLFESQNRKCALTGLPLQISTRSHLNSASIDRIDSSIGYTLSNVQWVHKHVNFMKGSYSQEYFIQMCKLIADHNIA